MASLMKQDVDDLQPYKTAVEALRPLFGDAGAVRFWEEIARLMNEINQDKTAWSRSYMAMVYNGQIRPSAKFLRAAAVLEARIESESPVAASSVPFVGYVLAGRVKPGSIILGSSRECERPGCKTSYVPVVPWQRFCCRACRDQFHRQQGWR